MKKIDLDTTYLCTCRGIEWVMQDIVMDNMKAPMRWRVPTRNTVYSIEDTIIYPKYYERHEDLYETD